MSAIDAGTDEGALDMAWWEDKRGPRLWVRGRGKSQGKRDLKIERPQPGTTDLFNFVLTPTQWTKKSET
ncbi:hypothetical protein Pmani_019943 [Petrolisthes manimaculis]|uniref:Uncharacterized protein n=1 Tax=Petrolisthes manimaculis TaxID=1843537 RepID=A0AAE1PIM5_9EUCA|nr:hypothetical protein Pmani_019943 [Petrolisthes manimaculis]